MGSAVSKMIIRLVKCILLDGYINSNRKTKKKQLFVEDIKEICYNICTDYNYGDFAIIINTKEYLYQKTPLKIQNHPYR